MMRKFCRGLRGPLLIAFVALGLVLACSRSTPCGNNSEVWIHRVIDGDCTDCLVFELETPIFQENRFRVRPLADYVIDSCDVVQVGVHPDAVTLVLSPATHSSLKGFRERASRDGKSKPLLVRVAGAKNATAAIEARQVSRVMTLFDFDSVHEIEMFVQDLGPEVSAIRRSSEHLAPTNPVASPAQLMADELIREIDAELAEHEERQPNAP